MSGRELVVGVVVLCTIGSSFCAIDFVEINWSVFFAVASGMQERNRECSF